MLSDNGRTAIGYGCATLIIIAFVCLLIVIEFPSEITININMSADDNMVEITENIESASKNINYTETQPQIDEGWLEYQERLSALGTKTSEAKNE